MKVRFILFILVIILFTNINIATSFELTKISEFSQSEIYDQSNSNMSIQNNYLYAVNRRSFEIFEIQNDTISLITDFNMQGRLSHLSLKDNFAYVATWGRTSRLYRIDISNVFSPIITDTLFYLGNYANFIDGNNVFVHELLPDWTWRVHVYDNESFQEITVFNVPHELWTMHHVCNGTGVVSNYYDQSAYLYNISDPENISLIASDFTGNVSFPYYTDIIQDSVFVIGSGLSKLKMYNISNPFNWQLISEIDNGVSDFRISGDKIVMIGGLDIWLYDISNLTNPVLLDYDSYDFDTYSGMTIESNKVFLTGYLKGELIYYSIENDCFDEITTYKNYGWLPSIYIYDDNLYIQTYLNGIGRWNITNMSTPNYIENYNSNYLSITKLRGDGDILVQSCIKKSNFQITDFIFSINEYGSLTVLDSLLSSYYGPLAYKEGVGFFKAYNYIFYKYRLNDNNELEEVATITLPVRQGEIYFYNNVAYLLAHEKFIVIKNINTDDEIEVALEINTNYISNQTVGFFQNFFFLSEENIPSNCSIFDISDPLYPTLVDTIYNNGAIGIDEENELLFMGRNICSIYDLSNIENNSINEIYSFQNWSYAQQTIPFMRNCNNYLLYLEDTSVSIYEYSTIGIDDELQQVNDIQFTNYPNPFSTSTTISFFNTKPSKNTKIKIYNVKGQLVKEFKRQKAKGKIEWDGKDENGKQVPSGIYLCKLSIGKETIVRKMVLLR